MDRETISNRCRTAVGLLVMPVPVWGARVAFVLLFRPAPIATPEKPATRGNCKHAAHAHASNANADGNGKRPAAVMMGIGPFGLAGVTVGSA